MRDLLPDFIFVNWSGSYSISHKLLKEIYNEIKDFDKDFLEAVKTMIRNEVIRMRRNITENELNFLAEDALHIYNEAIKDEDLKKVLKTIKSGLVNKKNL